MRIKSERYLKKVKDILIKNEYMKASEIATKCHIKPWKVYQLIRQLRIVGIGVIPTRKGYILSEYAKFGDDTGFIRRCMGRRTSDIVAIEAAKKDILTRWKSIPEGKNNLSPLIYHISNHDKKIAEKATQGLKFMLSHVNGKGI